jgi:AAA family ATP:ADP antiporter
MSANSNEIKFSPLRAFLWPVSGKEIKKVLPLALIMFFVLFNYTILRDVKDALLLTAHGCGSESFAFLKTWGTLPFVILLMGFYGKLATMLSKPALFRTTICFFLGFFVILGYLVLPNTQLLHASPEWIDAMAIAYPNIRYITALIGNWSFALFYIFAELWGTIGLSVIFWQLANEITKVSEAKRIYPLFGLVANFGVILSGQLLVLLTNKHSHVLSNQERWGKILNWIILCLLVAFCTILYLHNWIQNNVLTDKNLYNPEEIGSKKKSKIKLTFSESIKIVFRSKYLGFITLLLLGYGMTINFVEVTFKSQVKVLFENNTSDITKFYGWYSTVTGVAAVFLMIIGANMTRKFSWKTCALVTPLVTLVTGSAFFLLILFRQEASVLLSAFNISPVALAVFIGAGLVVLTKGAKYSIFDPTKEMAYIPLDDQIKTQGKAAVDGVGGRLGKSGGGIIQQMFFIISPVATQMTIAPYLGIILVVVSVMWVYSVLGLSKLYEQKKQEMQDSNS